MPLAFDALRRQGYKPTKRNCWICGNDRLIFNYHCTYCERDAHDNKYMKETDDTPILTAKECYWYHPWQLKSAMWQEFLHTKKGL
jgi:hypothetical protein